MWGVEQHEKRVRKVPKLKGWLTTRSQIVVVWMPKQ